MLDQSRCIGCHACTTACKSENDVPIGVTRTYVKSVDVGVFPHVRRAFQVTRCNQCEDAPCVTACPTRAMYKRPDGVVDFDKSICIGCKACIAACPYDAIFINPEDHSAEKCNFCAHRLDIGLEPSCVSVCPTEAILVGDLNDPTSKVARIVSRQAVSVRRPEKETHPGLQPGVDQTRRLELDGGPHRRGQGGLLRGPHPHLERVGLLRRLRAPRGSCLRTPRHPLLRAVRRAVDRVPPTGAARRPGPGGRVRPGRGRRRARRRQRGRLRPRLHRRPCTRQRQRRPPGRAGARRARAPGRRGDGRRGRPPRVPDPVGTPRVLVVDAGGVGVARARPARLHPQPRPPRGDGTRPDGVAVHVPAAHSDPHPVGQLQVARRAGPYQPGVDPPRRRRPPRRDRHRRPGPGDHRDRLLRGQGVDHRGIRPGVVACSHHMGRWKLRPHAEGRGAMGVGAMMATVDLARDEAGWAMRKVEGVKPYRSADPDTARIWWSDTGVHQNLTFGVQPDPISGMHCWHQAVRGTPARRGDAQGDVAVDTEAAREVYRRWMAQTRPAGTASPDGTRRPAWLMRPLKPVAAAFVIPDPPS